MDESCRRTLLDGLRRPGETITIPEQLARAANDFLCVPAEVGDRMLESRNSVNREALNASRLQQIGGGGHRG